MVLRFLIIASLLSVSPAFTAELCLSCHNAHYTEVGSCNLCHRGNPATGRKDLAHKGILKGSYARFMIAGESQKTEWSSRLNALGCRRCHKIGAQGNALAADLDQAVRKKSPEELAAAIRTPAKAMPDFRLDDGAIEEVVTALLAASQKCAPVNKPVVQLVHFDGYALKKQDVFSRKCGGCHKALTRRNGLLGRGDVAPNLSGLFSPFYPAREQWNDARLKKWLHNPRKVKNSATMQPVAITPAEQLELNRFLGTDD